MSQNQQRPRGYSFDGSLLPAKVLAAEAEYYHRSRERGFPQASGSHGPLPAPFIISFPSQLYDELMPNPIPPSHAVQTNNIRTIDPEPRYAPNRQQDIASKPARQYLKYMTLSVSPKTLIPNCKPCLYSTEHYRFLHYRPPGNPQPTENYKLVKFLSEVPVSAVNTLHFQTTSTLPGISMTQLLHQSVAAADAENAFSLHEKHPLIRLVCRAFGYADMICNIHTVCSHGAITAIGLAYAIARNYNYFLLYGRRQDPRIVPQPVYSGSRDYRLIAVYMIPQPNGEHYWYAHVAFTSSDGRLR